MRCKSLNDSPAVTDISLRQCISTGGGVFFLLAQQPPQWVRASSLTRFLGHTQRRTTVCRDSSGRVISSSQRPILDKHATFKTDIHAPGGIRTHNLSKRAGVDQRLRPRDHRHWPAGGFQGLVFWIGQDMSPRNSYILGLITTLEHDWSASLQSIETDNSADELESYLPRLRQRQTQQ